MSSDGFYTYTLTARERKQLADDRQRARRAHEKLYHEWLLYYRALGLGDQRALHHASRKARARKVPPSRRKHV